MRGIIQSLSTRTEFAIVTLVGFGYFTLGSLTWFIYRLGTGPMPSTSPITAQALLRVLWYELAALAVLGVFLRLRRWSAADFNLQISTRLTVAGLVLAGGFYLAYGAFYLAVTAIYPEGSVWFDAPGLVSDDLDLYTIVATSIVNPVFEEVLVVGYVMAALRKKKGFWYAANVSVLIRLLYHLYQGPLALVSIIPLGWVFCYVYGRWSRLWPLIVAHAVMDFVGLTVAQME